MKPVYGLVLLVLVACHAVQATHPRVLHHVKRQNKPSCQNSRTVFANGIANWIPITNRQDTYEITPEGLKLKLLPPASYQRLLNAQTQMPYNTASGQGVTFNATTYMQYGRFSATLKSANAGGAVTAVILIADGGDEIDYEMVGGAPHTVQSNYFWGNHPLYGVNSGTHQVPGGTVDEQFHTYTIDWTPERITWEIDGSVVRTKERSATCEGDVCKFPSNPARVQIGLWDGSLESGTAEWAHGPIDWEKQGPISAYLQEMVVECNPQYNYIVG